MLFLSGLIVRPLSQWLFSLLKVFYAGGFGSPNIQCFLIIFTNFQKKNSKVDKKRTAGWSVSWTNCFNAQLGFFSNNLNIMSSNSPRSLLVLFISTGLTGAVFFLSWKKSRKIKQTKRDTGFETRINYTIHSNNKEKWKIEEATIQIFSIQQSIISREQMYNKGSIS